MLYLTTQTTPLPILTLSALKRSKRTWFLCFVVILAAVLRLYHLDFQSYWGDEIASLEYAAPDAFRSFWNAELTGEHEAVSEGIWGVIEASKWEPNPPLYWLLLHYWVTLGKDEYTVRLLSAVLGILFVPLVYLFTKEMYDAKIALSTALLAALSPFHIWYSQEARPYALMMTLSIAASLLFLKTLSINKLGYYVAYTIVSLIGLYSFSYVIFIILSHIIFISFNLKKYKIFFRRYLTAFIIILLLFLSITLHKLYIYGYQYGSHVDVGIYSGFSRLIHHSIGSHKEINFLVIFYTLFTFSTGLSVGPSVTDLHISNYLNQVYKYIYIIAPIFLIFSLLFSLGIKHIIRKRNEFIFSLLYIMLPILCAYIIAKNTNITYNARYVGMSLPAYYMIISCGIYTLRTVWMKHLAVILLILSSLYALNNYYFNEKYAKEDVRSALAYIRRNTDAKDLVVILSHFSPYRYYAWANKTVTKASGTRRLRYYHGKDLVLYPLRKTDRAALADSDGLEGLITPVLEGYSRVWVVVNPRWRIDPEERLSTYLHMRFPSPVKQRFANTTVTLYKLHTDWHRML